MTVTELLEHFFSLKRPKLRCHADKSFQFEHVFDSGESGPQYLNHNFYFFFLNMSKANMQTKQEWN